MATEIDRLAEQAGEAARLMKLLANERRLLVLCKLAGAGEMTVGGLANAVGLSQSALSQHLSRMRARDSSDSVARARRSTTPSPTQLPSDSFPRSGKFTADPSPQASGEFQSMRTLKDIDVKEAHALLDRNAIFIDVREAYEQAAERIPGAISAPLSALARGEPVNAPTDRPKVFLCASGNRTRNNAAALATPRRRRSLLHGRAASWPGGRQATRSSAGKPPRQSPSDPGPRT